MSLASSDVETHGHQTYHVVVFHIVSHLVPNTDRQKQLGGRAFQVDHLLECYFVNVVYFLVQFSVAAQLTLQSTCARID